VINNRVQLKILGITYSQVQTGAYALILREENGRKRISIIIGTPEAQSIAIFLEGLNPPRPLTHDLFVAFARAVGEDMRAVDIYKYEDGVFFSRLIFHNDQTGVDLAVDSRTSDAIALAVRFNAPIYIAENIIREVGIVMQEEDIFDEIERESQVKKGQVSYEEMNREELQKILNEAINAEDYEKASLLRDLINNKQNN
jgi:bifunctional DNase/RNase